MEERLEALSKKYHVEVWRSDDNRSEVHIFKPGSPNVYIMGFNPDFISANTVEWILKEFDWSAK